METEKNKMGTKAIGPLLFSMSTPPIISMMVQSLYNIVDSMFVARIGEDALTAVSLGFPLQFLLLAAALGVGIGTNSYISRKLGEGQVEKANEAASHAVLLSIGTYLLFVVLGIFCIEPFLKLFSDSPQIIQYGKDYLNVIVFVSIGLFLHIAIEKVLQATGKMIIPMMLQIFGAIINVILDPILIFGLFGFPAMGVKGAAIATVIGQCSAMTLAFLVMVFGKHEVKLKFRGLKIQFSIIKQIYVVGIPAMMMNALNSLVIMGLNSILSGFSNTAVSVYGIYFKLQTFVYMPVSGLIQGAMPIMGYNYGARNKERLLRVLKLSILTTFVIMLAGTILFWVFPEQLLALFQASPEMVAIGRYTLRIISIGYLPAVLGFIFATFFQAMGKGVYSLLIFLIRQLIVALPLAFFLAPRLGLNGVWFAFPAAEILGAIVASILVYHVYRRDPIFQKEIQ